MAKWLTKSDYMKFLTHPAYLWLQKYDKNRLPSFDEAAQALVNQGNEVEAVARKLFNDGEAVTSLFAQAVTDTDNLIKRSPQVIYQATVLTRRNLYAMADILVRSEADTWDIYEVKSSTKAKDSYLADLAFQRVAFEEYGHQINRLYLVYINNQYVRQGEIEPSKFLTVREVTAEVEAITPRTKRTILAALAIMALPECPDLDPATATNYYDWMQIYRHLNPNLTSDSIYNLCRLTPAQVQEFSRLGVTTINEVPTGVALKPQQITQIAAVKSGRPITHRLKIAHKLKILTYPLWFLDYETTFPALPDHDGIRPYQQVPFQYSLHVLPEPGGVLKQHEYLATGSGNPMPGLVKQLRLDLGETGSVIVWNKSFEMSVNDGLGVHFPEFKSFLKGVNKRVFDLMEIFGSGLYAEAGFYGSASIKKVLPVIVPELSYKALSIGEGQTASRRWAEASSGKLSAAETEAVYQDLREYCGQDTLAMVRIYEFLMRQVEELPKQTDLFAIE